MLWYCNRWIKFCWIFSTDVETDDDLSEMTDEEIKDAKYLSIFENYYNNFLWGNYDSWYYNWIEKDGRINDSGLRL